LLDTASASKFVIFSVYGLKDEKLVKQQIYMKTEAYKLYSRVFWTLLLNVIKFDPYNFELYYFKVGAFFLRHSAPSLAKLGNIESFTRSYSVRQPFDEIRSDISCFLALLWL